MKFDAAVLEQVNAPLAVTEGSARCTRTTFWFVSVLSMRGQRLYHFLMVSSHAQYCVVPEAGAIQVSNDIPFDRACLICCGVITGFGAASMPTISSINRGRTTRTMSARRRDFTATRQKRFDPSLRRH